LVQLLHRRAKIADQFPALSSEIVKTILARSINERVLFDVPSRRSRRRCDGDEAITEQPRTSNRELAAGGNPYVVVDSQRHCNTGAVWNETWSTGNAADLGASEQDIRP